MHTLQRCWRVGLPNTAIANHTCSRSHMRQLRGWDQISFAKRDGESEMFSCTRASNDPLLEIMLRKYHLHLLRWPITGIQPGQLIVQKNARVIRSPAGVIFKAELENPDGTGEDMTDIEEVFSGKLDAAAGIKLTDYLAAMFGGVKGSLQAAYGKAAKIVLRIGLAEWHACDPAALSDFVHSAELRPDQGLFRDGDKLYVMTGVATARSLEILAYGAGGVQLTGSINEAAGNFTMKSEKGGGITYKSKQPIVFGVELFELVPAGDEWMLRGAEKFVQVRGGESSRNEENHFPTSAVAFIGDPLTGDAFLDLGPPTS